MSILYVLAGITGALAFLAIGVAFAMRYQMAFATTGLRAQARQISRRRLLIWFVILVGGGFLGHTLLTPRTSVEAASPDGRYVAKVSAAFPLFGGYRYSVKVRDSDGYLRRHLVIRDKRPGWGHDPSIDWAEDSKTVTVGLHDGDADDGPVAAHKRLSIDL